MSQQTLINGESYLSHRTKINSNFTELYDAGTQAMVIIDQKGNGINGGAFTSGSYQTRTLNTIEQNTITGASLSSNQFTLPAGHYRLWYTAPVYDVDRHRAKIRNITNSVDLHTGLSAYTNSALGHGTNWSSGYVEFTSIGTYTFELQHRCGTTNNIDGFGVSANTGDFEKYSQVIIHKLPS